MNAKCFYLVFVLCTVQQSLSSPIEYDLTEGRGIGSTLWGWISYPFSWWGSETPEPPVTEQLVASTTLGPNDSIEVGKRNVTVWCNDQTCTTMKCDRGGCRNVTCNIYDTDMAGECREYNNEIKPEEPVTAKPIELSTTLADKVTVSSSVKPEETTSEPISVAEVEPSEPPAPAVEEKPLELEVVLSSTVNEQDQKLDETE